MRPRPLTWIQSEPALILGAVQSGIGLVMSFGFQLSGQQVGAIMAFSAAVLSVVCRQLVTPNSRTGP